MAMRLTQPLCRAVRAAPDGLAVVDGARRRSWREVYDRVTKGAAILEQAGAQSGDRIAVLAENSATYFELFFAVPWAGAVIVPINTRLTEAEVADILIDCQPSCLLYSPGLEDKAQGAAGRANVKNLIRIDDPGDPASYEAGLNNVRPIDEAMRGGSDLGGLFYTSGTTGRQKGVMLTHDVLMSNAISVLTYIHFDRASVNIHAAPMFHLADIGIYPVTMVAGTHVFPRQVSAEALVEAIAEHDVTHCMTVPILIERMARHVTERGIALPSLKLLGYGGSPITSAALDLARKTWPAAGFVQGYGLTEAPSFTFLGAPYHTAEGERHGKLRSAGEPVYSFEVDIRDPETGQSCAAGTVGEICARGPHVMAGYWRNREATEQALKGGWLHTGDAGFLDEDGFLTITDRIKDMIVTGGENVYSLEVENVLTRYPGVLACAVVGLPDPNWGEAVHAVIVAVPGAEPSAESLAAHCRAHLAGYKCPKSFILQAEGLPLTSSGKVRKSVLREALRQTIAP